MEKRNSILDDIINTYLSIYFIKNILPFIILIVALIFGIHYIFQRSISATMTSEEKANSIFYTKFAKEIQQIAERTVNSNDFEIECRIGDTYSLYDINLIYTVRNKDLSSEEYEKIIKQQITMIYNVIKDKKVVNDTFNRSTKIKTRIQFSFMYDHSSNVHALCFVDLDYNEDNMYGNQYEEIMKKSLVKEDELNKFRK